MKRHLLAAASAFAVAAGAQCARAQDLTARNLAANCTTCHGTNGNSAGGVPPSLAGRERSGLVETMKAFRSGARPATVMQQQAKGYTDDELELIAGFFALQKPAAARMPSKP